MPKRSIKEEILDDGSITIRYSIKRKEPCIIDYFFINGISASLFDFGTIKDIGRDSSFFGCTNRQFLKHGFLPKATLDKYKISDRQASLICLFLQQKLSLGKCDYCFRKI